MRIKEIVAVSILKKTLPGIIGVLIIVVSSLLYQIVQSRMSFFSVENLGLFEVTAYSYFVAFSTGIVLMLLGTLQLLRFGKERIQGIERIPINWRWLIPHIFTIQKYVKIFLLSTILYGLFYSYVTSIIVYQPSINFSEAYVTDIPSVRIIACCGSLGQIPILILYLTEHVGILLFPLSLLLLTVVSLLVGLNFSMAAFAYGNRPKGYGNWFCGFSAVVGLFTGCPTCAGVFFASFILGASVASTSALFTAYQSLFLGISIPVLSITPLLIAKSLSKTSMDGCIIKKK